MPSYCDVHFRTYRFPKWPYGNAPFPDNTKYKLLAIDPAILYHYELWALKWALSIAGKSSYPMRSPLFMLFPDVHILFFPGEKHPIQKPWWKVGDETMVKDHCEKMGVFQTGKRITIASIVLGINYSDSIIYVGLQCSNVIQTCFYSWGAKNMVKEMQKIILLATFQLKLDSQNSPEIQKSTVASTRESRNLKKILRRPSRRWSCDKVPGYQVYGGNSGSLHIYIYIL